jgi:hypothetical protein
MAFKVKKAKKRYKYPFKSTEEAEEYFFGKNPRKHKDYKYFKGEQK